MTTIVISALIFAAIYFAIAKLIALGSGWHKLARAFPVQKNSVPLCEFDRSITQCGAINFRGNSSAGSGAGHVQIQADGLRVHIANPFMKNLLIPFERLELIRISSLLGRTDFCIEIAEFTAARIR